MKKICISVDNISLKAELTDSLTAKAIFDFLPIESTVNLWGDEIYFNIPLDIELDPDAQAEVEVGDLGYWPSGPAFCIFFGKTPVSTQEKPRAYSPVNVFGQVKGDTTVLKSVKQGTKIKVEKIDSPEHL